MIVKNLLRKILHPTAHRLISTLEKIWLYCFPFNFFAVRSKLGALPSVVTKRTPFTSSQERGWLVGFGKETPPHPLRVFTRIHIFDCVCWTNSKWGSQWLGPRANTTSGLQGAPFSTTTGDGRLFDRYPSAVWSIYVYVMLFCFAFVVRYLAPVFAFYVYFSSEF